ALAAAQELALPSERSPIELASEYAGRNGASLLSCTCAPASLEATVEVTTPIGPMFLAGDSLVVRARARAVVDLAATPG
ncbi:MAG TPA: hypothetical protein VF351_07800, partial [Actinomycetota bacterium]